MKYALRGVFEPTRYPPPPPPSVAPSKKGEGLPDAPGIYFVWEGEEIVYVGLSRRLCQRAKLGHRNIREGDRLSFLRFPDEDLERIEAFYIGVIYPKRNSYGRQVPWWKFNQ